ncbi:hypothetical protein [Rhodovulum sp.]|uniref:hypothetical protein n=1 Tax=Rhodovulum sp. TaxID=34009 RepID=UPI0017E7E666|nr:hypothetical protein [Rhodovulum sp.]HDR28859.1 hypothetical protein [Rhodovulum sp.]
MVDFAIIDILWRAMDGEVEPMAKHIEAGGDLPPDFRAFLAAHLRNELPKRPGNKRTFSQVQMEAGIVSQIRYIMRIMGCSAYKAQKLYLQMHPSMNEETLKTYWKKSRRRAKNRVSKPV